jgi:hypothetical protein
MRTTHPSLHTSHAGLHIDGETIARTVATFVGAAFLGVGFVGLISPGMLGTHLNPTHTAIHFASGALSLWFGILGSARSAATFCLVFGVVYGLLGVAGFLFGLPDQHTLTGIVHGADTRLLRVIPGQFELATPDHILHVVIGTAYLVAGMLGLTAHDDPASESYERHNVA